MSIDTRNYRTKSIYKPRVNQLLPNGERPERVTLKTDEWPIGLDIGYSGVKGYCYNAIFSFPSYAKNIGPNPTFYGKLQEDEILYKDLETGDVWRVGRNAENMLSERDTSSSQLELYGRDRYYTMMFLVLIRTGIALGIQSNECGDYNGERIVIQTGLPPAYKEADTEPLTDAFAGQHKFAIKTARTDRYITYDLNITRKDVRVMSQPEGTLMSIAMDDSGRTLKGAQKYFSNVIIWDAGFGTFDLFDISNQTIHSKESFGDFGMRAVLEETCKKIHERDGVVVRPQVMQNILEKGTVTVQTRTRGKIASRLVPIADLLEEASQEVCEKAVEKVIDMYSGLDRYQFLVLTGGTAAAWRDQVKEAFSQVENLTVIDGNINCPDLDMIFCNVRGYFLYLINALKQEALKKKQ